jgi:NADPH2:quinone reductase
LTPGQVRVAIRAAGINFPDILMAAGEYQLKPPLPFTPGVEAAGDVVEVNAAISMSGKLIPAARMAMRTCPGVNGAEAIVSRRKFSGGPSSRQTTAFGIRLPAP